MSVLLAGGVACLPAPREGNPGSPPLNQVLSAPLKSLGARPTETDTHQGESHDAENIGQGPVFYSWLSHK